MVLGLLSDPPVINSAPHTWILSGLDRLLPLHSVSIRGLCHLQADQPSPGSFMVNVHLQLPVLIPPTTRSPEVLESPPLFFEALAPVLSGDFLVAPPIPALGLTSPKPCLPPAAPAQVNHTFHILFAFVGKLWASSPHTQEARFLHPFPPPRGGPSTLILLQALPFIFKFSTSVASPPQ